MLVLSRNVGQRIIIGDNIVIEIVRVSGNKVRIGIEAPKEIGIVREEIATIALKTRLLPEYKNSQLTVEYDEDLAFEKVLN